MAELDEVQNQIDSFKVVEKNKTLDDQIDKFEKELDPIKEKDFIKYVKMDEEEEKDIRLLQESLGSGISVKKSGFEKVKKPKKEEEQDWAEIVKEDVLFLKKKKVLMQEMFLNNIKMEVVLKAHILQIVLMTVYKVIALVLNINRFKYLYF